ncbi:hypothetical protein [Bosea vaviloviae]|uniref:Uncharacterized protein n=1 Tax=Bosea vaviloviae TaxID=1526658 RepID=A0A0N1N159_9HYPH|nr:hypothetical protein [Bosea vaviloviae]KPH80553.1 hypothetical protein AE618_12325 [Bosea vaviloviae]
MSELRDTCRAIAARAEEFKARRIRLSDAVRAGQDVDAELGALLQEVLQQRADVDNLLRSAGITEAGLRSIEEESDRIFRKTGGNATEEDFRSSNIGKIIAGFQARRSVEGGEA